MDEAIYSQVQVLQKMHHSRPARALHVVVLPQAHGEQPSPPSHQPRGRPHTDVSYHSTTPHLGPGVPTEAGWERAGKEQRVVFSKCLPLGDPEIVLLGHSAWQKQSPHIGHSLQCRHHPHTGN